MNNENAKMIEYMKIEHDIKKERIEIESKNQLKNIKKIY